MKPIQLFGVGLFGKSHNVTSQRRLNCYYEIQQEEDKTRVAIYGTPGLDLFTNFGDTPVRGQHVFIGNEKDYFVHRGTFWEVNNAGTQTSRGTLLTTAGRVDISDNGTQITIVDGTYGYTFNTSTNVFAQITDVDFPVSNTTTFLDGYTIVNKVVTGRFYISSAYNSTTWDGTEYGTAESSPDYLVRVFADHGDLCLFGEISTEFWDNTGATDFPFARKAVSEFGLAARWSLAKYDNSLAFLAKNRQGEVFLAKLNGYQSQRLSSFEFEYIINGYATVSDATCYAYTLGGHPMLQINFPSAGTSWLYDGSTQLISQLKSYGITRHRGEIYGNYLNQNIVTDYANGKVYKLKPDVYTDNGEEIELELISKHISTGGNTIFVISLQIEMESGVGLITGQGSDPQAMISVSRDGGHTYGSESLRSFGAIGKYLQRARWLRLGRGRDLVFKLRITDPVKRVITGANMDYEAGNS